VPIVEIVLAHFALRANHKGNIKFPNPLLLPRSISNNERGRTKAIDKNLDT
jgi:hypothetical protein